MSCIRNFSLAAALFVGSLAPVRAEDARAQFFHTLAGLCGARYEGAMTFPTSGLDDFAGKLLVATIASCSEKEIRIPFLVGADASRTWVFNRTAQGLHFQHDHRHGDGTPDAVTLYGGMAEANGSAYTQRFPADAYTAQLIPAARTNVWTLTLSADFNTLSYHLQRDGQPRFSAELKRVQP